MAHPKAFFLPMGQGNRFCLLHAPSGIAAMRGAVVFVHPFAEEMNNSRRVVAIQARAFADAGWTVLQIDLFGCGDSSGDFGEASWQRWLDDVIEATVWLGAKTGHAPMLWGLRAGCLLCVQAASSMERPPRLVLWQPVISGKQHLQQFLRLKIAHQLIDGTGSERTGTQALREQLAGGEPVEVAGYSVLPALALGLEAAELDVSTGPAHIAWLDVTGSAGRTLSPASRMRIQKIQDSAHRVDARAIEGPAFWQNPASADCPALIAATLSMVETRFAQA